MPKRLTLHRPSVVPGTFARALWWYRVAIFGGLAFLLALIGEQLMRASPPDTATNPDLGMRLVQIAALLVGLVAWVRNGVPVLRLRRKATAGQVVSDAPPGALPVRRATERGPELATSRRSLLRRLVQGYLIWRARVGWMGAGLGLLVVLNLAIWCYRLLQQDFSDPLAPWLWIAMLAALALTFAGVPPPASAESLLPHDPAEPREEPPVSRAEWLIIGLILAAALVLRVWNLEYVPVGPYTDEGDRANVARAINGLGSMPLQFPPFSFFSTDWWGVPTAYFWLVAQSLKVFGNTLAGARMVHALAGVATVWFTYRTARVVWSPRAGLIAGGLMAASDFAIQFSRTAGESTITILAWTVCFYYLYRALKTLKPVHFALSGIAGGLTLYGYASGKLLPVFLGVVAVYLLVRWGLTGIKRYLPGLVLLALAAGLTFAPNGLFLLAHPDTLTERYKGVSIFNHQDQFFAEYRTNNWPVVLAGQLQLTYKAFDIGGERGPFYPSHQPVLPVPWAALWLLGTAYLVWRAGDARYALLGIWLLGGLAGAALTNDTPTLQRTATMVPILSLIPAVFLDRVIGGALLAWPVRVRWRARALRLAANSAVAALVLLLATQTLPFYFGTYTAEAHYYEFTLVGRYAQKLDPARDVVYQSGVPALLGSPAPTTFLAGDVALKELGNPSDDYPLLNNDGKNAHLLYFPPDDPTVTLLRSYYPGSTKSILKTADNKPFIAALKVGADSIDALRVTTARYGSDGGPVFERKEPRLGTGGVAGDSPIVTIQPPLWMTYPLQAEWTGGLVVPAYGKYQLRLSAPAGAAFEIDGRAIVSATGSLPADTQVALARGVHPVRLVGTLASPRGQVELRWGTDQGLLVPVSRLLLWNGPLGTLYGQLFSNMDKPDLMTANPLPSLDINPATERRDGTLDWHNFNGDAGIFAVWRGKLVTPVDGEYDFNVDTGGYVSIWVDGQMVGSHGLQAGWPLLPAALRLAAGQHDFQVRLRAVNPNNSFVLTWRTPGRDTWELLSMADFAPSEGGAWLAQERPNAPDLDPTQVVVGSPKLPVLTKRLISGSRSWTDAHALAVWPDGHLAVGDAGAHKVLLYAADGRQVAAWGQAGPGDGQFYIISDLAISPDGLLAVLDAGNGDIQTFSRDGRQLGHLKGTQIPLSQPSGIAWGPNGEMYVADTASNRVVRVSRSGQVEAVYGAQDSNYLPLDRPLDVAVTPKGTVYAVDTRGRVVRFDGAGLIDAEYPLLVGQENGGSRMAVWGDMLAVTNPERNSISFVDLKTGAVHDARFADKEPLTLKLPVGIAADSGGLLYVLDSGNNRVVVLAKAP